MNDPSAYSCLGSKSIRREAGGAYSHLDCVVLGLWLDRSHGEDLQAGGFNGFYTYFASEGFSFGSSPRHWEWMCRFAREHGMVCSLSVGPGYKDDKIRPWNGHTSQARREGGYYDDMWREAVKAGAEVRRERIMELVLIINATSGAVYISCPCFSPNTISKQIFLPFSVTCCKSDCVGDLFQRVGRGHADRTCSPRPSQPCGERPQRAPRRSEAGTSAVPHLWVPWFPRVH